MEAAAKALIDHKGMLFVSQTFISTCSDILIGKLSHS